MPPIRVICCDEPECDEPARFKLAAPWGDGCFWELKTYGFACAEHLREVLRSAESRWLDYEPVRGEVVGMMGIYVFEPGERDRQRVRFETIEEVEGMDFA